ncbi:hypothetical protein ACIQZI_09395 [Peribacillus sp. NPDC096379]|uniref:hypothetical protein n=1 Tax=Peribacillus sp. NPDC096379 TaxID=3364393 RepID=UPI00381801C5
MIQVIGTDIGIDFYPALTGSKIPSQGLEEPIGFVVLLYLRCAEVLATLERD